MGILYLRVLSHNGYIIPEGWQRLGGNRRAAALVPWPPRQALWAGPNAHAGGGPTVSKTNTR
jgi:hypothetical protein